VGCQVLIVEDDWLQVENLEALLELEGYSLCGNASTGEQAVALAQSKQPQAVLMDVALDGRIDGVETAKRIRQVCRCAVIFLTGRGDRAAVARMREAEPDEILVKPTSAAEIMAALKRVVTAAESRG